MRDHTESECVPCLLDFADLWWWEGGRKGGRERERDRGRDGQREGGSERECVKEGSTEGGRELFQFGNPGMPHLKRKFSCRPWEE